jgi:uncharacterized protein (TIGR04255 family)
MPINEIFPNPLAKQVIFQVRFPNLFFLEGRIGDFQVGVMKEFPESSLVFQRQFLIAHGDTKSLSDAIDGTNSESVNKVWQFRSPEGVELNLTGASLSIASTSHKTYDIGDTGRFRDTIEAVCKTFLDVTKIPLFTRVGLRYINDCPIPKNTTVDFKRYYNTTLPLDRFPLESAVEMQSVFVTKSQSHGLRYCEILAVAEKTSYALDIDAYADNVQSGHLMTTTDLLHKEVRSAFEKGIKQPVIDLMRVKK